MAGRLSDKGVFNPQEAEAYLNAAKQIAPSIGKEFTGPNFFQFMKYARSARYGATPEAIMAGMLSSEEMGASSAGVAFNQAQAVTKFAAMVGSTATARDLITGAILRAVEGQREIERAKQRDPRLAVDPKSILTATAGLTNQIQGALGEAVTAFEPVLLPAMRGVTDWFSQLGTDIRAATEGDKEAQKRVESTTKTALTTGALAVMARGPIAAAISAAATPLGVTAGITGAISARDDTSRSLALAGVSLNTAAVSLQGAAAAQLIAANAPAGLMQKNVAVPWCGGRCRGYRGRAHPRPKKWLPGTRRYRYGAGGR